MERGFCRQPDGNLTPEGFEEMAGQCRYTGDQIDLSCHSWVSLVMSHDLSSFNMTDHGISWLVMTCCLFQSLRCLRRNWFFMMLADLTFWGPFHLPLWIHKTQSSPVMLYHIQCNINVIYYRSRSKKLAVWKSHPNLSSIEWGLQNVCLWVFVESPPQTKFAGSPYRVMV